MKKHRKPRGWGAWTPEKVIKACDGMVWSQREDGDWEPTQPLPYYSFWERLSQAWDVLNYRADALYWYFPKGWDRKAGFQKRKEEEAAPKDDL